MIQEVAMLVRRLAVTLILILLPVALLLQLLDSTAPVQAGAFLSEIQYREDINGDGKVMINDVIALLLLAGDNPDDSRIDYNGDGKYSITDAIAMLINIMSGNLTLVDGERDYRQDMRDFVQDVSLYAKGIKPGFIIIPQNGHELLTENGEETGTLALRYLEAIDGVGREDLFYGYDDDDAPTPPSARDYMIAFMDIARNNGIVVLVTDYCWTQSFVDDSYEQNANRGYISFSADHRELDNIPNYPATPYNVNVADVTSLEKTKNFLYLLNPGSYITKSAFISAIKHTDYDMVITDLFYEGTSELTSEEITSMKVKTNGGTRLVIAYMSIGEAESYRYYWQKEWAINPPQWLADENLDWPGNYKVRYWDENWKSFIYGNNDSYLKRIIDAGFDWVYLDIIDAFEYFESR